jgi:hypothetical protein
MLEIAEDAVEALKQSGALRITAEEVDGEVEISIEDATEPAEGDEIVERDGRKILRNLRPDGVLEEHIDPRFHGGDGAVLEMRLFGKQELIENLKAAGFASIRVHEGPKFQIGVYWPGNQSVPVAARC